MGNKENRNDLVVLFIYVILVLVSTTLMVAVIATHKDVHTVQVYITRIRELNGSLKLVNYIMLDNGELATQGETVTNTSVIKLSYDMATLDVNITRNNTFKIKTLSDDIDSYIIIYILAITGFGIPIWVSDNRYFGYSLLIWAVAVMTITIISMPQFLGEPEVIKVT